MPKIISDESVYKTVLKLISDKSYLGTSTMQMAEAAGISEITLFRKYGTKAGLVKNAIRHLIDNDKISSAFFYTGDIHNDLIRIVDVYKDMVEQYGNFMIMLISEVPRSDELKDIFEIPYSLVEQLMKLIEKYQQQNIIKKEPVRHALSALIGPLMYEGMLINAIKGNESFNIDSKTYVEMFLNGRSAS